MFSTGLHVLSQPLSTKLDSFILSRNFPFSPMRLLIQKQCLATDESFKKKLHAPHSQCNVSAGGSNLESSMAIIFSESFPDSSLTGIAVKHVLCAQSPMLLAEAAAPSGSNWLQSPTNFGSIN